MPRTTGICSPGPRSRTCAAVACCLLLGSACAGESLLVGEERPLAGSGGAGPEPTGPVGSAGEDGVALLAQCPTSSGQRRQLLGCWPTRHVGRWSGFFLGVPRYETPDGTGADFPAGELRLSLGDDGNGELAFGVVEGASAATACDAPGRHAGCPPPGWLMPGFAYRLADLELFDPEDDLADPRVAGEPPLRRAERMGFRVAVGQPWEAWCAAQQAPSGGCGDAGCAKASMLPPPSAPDPREAAGALAGPPGCVCGAEGCRPDARTLPFELSMSEDGEALRGEYRPSDARLSEASLELTRQR